MQAFKRVTANPQVKTGLAPVKRRKSLMDHQLEAGATLFQQASSAMSLAGRGSTDGLSYHDGRIRRVRRRR